MSNLFQCRGCKAIYADSMPDGTLYMHTCPRLFDPRTGQMVPVAGGRDENLAVDSKGGVGGIKAEGAGVDALPATAAAEPPWITKLKSRLAKGDA